MIAKIRRRIKKFFLKKKLEKNSVFLKERVKLKKAIFHGRNMIGNDVDVEKSEIGFGTYIGNYTELHECSIGKYCSIGMRVKAVIGEHPIHYVTTHPFAYSDMKRKVGFDFEKRKEIPAIKKADGRFNIVIGNDVWLGDDVRILNGVKIGDGAVVAAGALVTKDVEPYSVVAGIPAKELKKRFEKEEIEELLKLKWWNRDIKWIEENVEHFCDIKRFLKKVKDDKME